MRLEPVLVLDAVLVPMGEWPIQTETGTIARGMKPSLDQQRSVRATATYTSSSRSTARASSSNGQTFSGFS